MDWKNRLKDQCPCFMGTINKNRCENNTCEIHGLKNLFVQDKDPTQIQVAQEMIKTGKFAKREIIFALNEIFNSNYVAAERRVEKAMRKLEVLKYKVFHSDDNKIKAWKD